MTSVNGTAVYSTLHPGVLPYVHEWARSVERQTDTGFDLWLAVDGLTKRQVDEVVPEGIEANLHWASPGATPAAVRSEVFSMLGTAYDYVVLVDADDVLHETRIAAAKNDLLEYDVSACALRLVDAAGRDLESVFGVVDPAHGPTFDDLLPRWNVVGGSNSAYRASVLLRCLPLPRECQIVDWYIATASWAGGARFHMDSTPRMTYRQYSTNTAKVMPPFSSDSVRAATGLVLQHYDLVLGKLDVLRGGKRDAVLSAREAASSFAERVLTDSRSLERYVDALNQLPPPRMWWTIVANPDLEKLWTQ